MSLVDKYGKELNAHEKSKLAYKVLQDLTGEEHPPGKDDFEDWVLRCLIAIRDRLEAKPAAPVIKKPATKTGAKA